MNQTRLISVPQGIGDSIWIMQKLLNANEAFQFLLPGGLPRRGKQVFDLLPKSLVASCDYDPDLYYRLIEAQNVNNTRNAWGDITEPHFCLSANGWLEKNRRIEEFLYDLPTTYTMPWETGDAEERVLKMLTEFDDTLPWKPRYIGIYGSAYSTQRAWNFWGDKEWFEFISELNEIDHTFCPVIIGAKWDTDMADILMSKLDAAGIMYVNTIGQDLAFFIEMAKQLEYGFYFPSGLGIIAGLLNVPAMMWYPTNQRHVFNILGMWKDPANELFSELPMNSVDDMIHFVKTKTNLCAK